MPRKIAFICHDNFQSLDLFGPLEVFAKSTSKKDDVEISNYETHILSLNGGTIQTSSGVPVYTRPFCDLKGFDSLIVAGGSGIYTACKQPGFCQFIQQSASKVNRIISICSGSFALAKAGLLKNKSATGHWDSIHRLSEVSKDISVESDAIYIKDGNTYTSAGVCAGMDLTLAIVEEDFGRAHAMKIARYLVIYYRRSGGQSQFSEQLQSQSIVNDRISEICAYINNNHEKDLSVPALAKIAHMSARNFSRKFTEEVGVPPGKYVEQARLKSAKEHLENSTIKLSAIARKSGFTSAEALRKSFKRQFGVSPSDFRLHFGCDSL